MVLTNNQETGVHSLFIPWMRLSISALRVDFIIDKTFTMSTADEFLGSTTWVHRMEQTFTMLDVDKSGYITRKDYDLGAKMIQKEMEPDPKLFALYCDAMEVLC